MVDTIKLAGVFGESIVDGPGIRFAIFTQGCAHHCPGCHNEETWDFDGGYLQDIDELVAQIKENPFVKNITFSGGDPLHQVEAVLTIVKKLGTEYHILIYTGYLYEHLLEKAKVDKQLEKLLQLTDILIDGRFILATRDLTLKFRGSDNQRIIDVKKSLARNEVVIINYD